MKPIQKIVAGHSGNKEIPKISNLDNISVDESIMHHKSIILNRYSAKVSNFLSNIENEVKDYGSLHNMTQQMSFNYYGRFLIELLQNAHDRFFKNGRSGKVKIILDLDQKIPVLYFANTGKPFQDSGFVSISDLAQSDKSPQESIGNKGVGFKSVLEVCIAPEIYSGNFNKEKGFSGFCFGFSPNSLEVLRPLVVTMLNDCLVPDIKSVFGVSHPLINWTAAPERISKLKKLIKSKNDNLQTFIEKELRFFSPYLLPIPLQNRPDDQNIIDLGNEGFVTVIKLPLKDEDALIKCDKAIAKFSAESFIFLEYLETFEVHIKKNKNLTLTNSVSIKSKEIVSANKLTVEEVSIYDLMTSDGPESYLLGRKEYEDTIKDDLNNALKELPESWHELRKLRLSLALSKEDLISGKAYIFLATEQRLNLGFHVNAPFYGEVDRKTIKLDKKINELNIRCAADLLYYFAEFIKSSNLQNRNDLIIGLLNFNFKNDSHSQSTEEESIGQRLALELTNYLTTQEISLSEWKVAPYLINNGTLKFGTLHSVLKFPEDKDLKIHSSKNITKVCGTCFIEVSNKFNECYLNLATYAGINVIPSSGNWATWSEAIANNLLKNRAPISKWQLYYNELVELFDSDSKQELFGKKILLGTNRKLYHVNVEGQDVIVFLTPQQSNFEDEEEEKISSYRIPKSLQDKVAYFHGDIKIYDEKRRQTKLFSLLVEGNPNTLVKPFRTAEIFDKIILPSLPYKHISFQNSKSKDLWEILNWIILLFAGARGDNPQVVAKKLKDILVPCRGGWYPAKEAYFSATWNDVLNNSNVILLDKFFNSIKRKNPNGYNRLLLKKDNFFNKLKKRAQKYVANVMSQAGVADYLRLINADVSKDIRIVANGYHFFLPENLEHVDKNQYDSYRGYIESQQGMFYNQFTYHLKYLKTIDGVELFSSFSTDIKIIFTKLIFYSMSKWGDWKSCYLSKHHGQADNRRVKSLVKHQLTSLQWIPVKNEDEIYFVKPNESWYIDPYFLKRSPQQFYFWDHIETDCASLIEDHLLLELNDLGVNPYEISTIQDTINQIDYLSGRLASNKIEKAHINFFKNAFQHAWDSLVRLSKDHDVGDKLPDKLVYTCGSYVPEVVEIGTKESRDNPIYIPDDKALLNMLVSNKNIRILYSQYRHNYAKFFKEYYSDKVKYLSEIEWNLLIDGKERQELQAQAEYLFKGSRYWLLPIILTVVSFRESEILDLNGSAFQKYLLLLKKLKITYCNSIEFELLNTNSQPILSGDLPLTIDADNSILYYDNSSELNLEPLASELRSYLDFAPIETSLALIFAKLNVNIDSARPDIDHILEALSLLKISKDDLNEVEKAISLELDWIKERLMPLIYVFTDIKKQDDLLEELISSGTEDSINRILNKLSNNLNKKSIIELIDKSKNSMGDRDIGEYLWERFKISLFDWNEALSKSPGVRSVIINENLSISFEEAKHRTQNGIYALLRRLLNESAINEEDYIKISADFENCIIPDSWAASYWILPEVDVIKLFLELFPDNLYSKELLKVNTIKGFIGKLNTLLDDVSISRTELKKENIELIDDAIEKLHRIIAAYNIKNDLPENYNLTDYNKWKESYITKSHVLIETQIIKANNVLYFFLASGNEFNISLPINDVAKIKSIEELIHELNLSEYEIENADLLLEKKKEEALRRKRLIRIGDIEFDTRKDNLKNLKHYLEKAFSSLSNINGKMTRSVNLSDVDKHYKKRKKRRSKESIDTPPKVSSQEKKDAVGLAGEIFAFNYLKEQFIDFDADNWKSEFSKYVFSSNIGDDELGYDFEYHFNGRIYQIEVKSTLSNTTEFQMGSTETKAARDAARKSNEITYQILFIRRALTDPELIWLSNPYLSRNNKYFSIEDTNAKIKFRFDK